MIINLKEVRLRKVIFNTGRGSGPGNISTYNETRPVQYMLVFILSLSAMVLVNAVLKGQGYIHCSSLRWTGTYPLSMVRVLAVGWAGWLKPR